MKKVRMYLYPHYVDAESALGLSSKLKKLFRKNDVYVMTMYYEGDIASIPLESEDSAAVFVRVSSRCKDPWPAIAEACEQRGFICFYDDSLVSPKGCCGTEALLKKASEVLELKVEK